MMEAEHVYLFVEIQESLGHVVQAKKLFMTPVYIVYAQVRLLQLFVEHDPKPRPNVQ